MKKNDDNDGRKNNNKSSGDRGMSGGSEENCGPFNVDDQAGELVSLLANCLHGNLSPRCIGCNVEKNCKASHVDVSVACVIKSVDWFVNQCYILFSPATIPKVNISD